MLRIAVLAVSAVFAIRAPLAAAAVQDSPPPPDIVNNPPPATAPATTDVAPVSVAATPAERLAAALDADFVWRSLGPTNMGGRITDIAVDPRRKSTFFVAAATGGVWKTENNGSSFLPIFDQYGTSSIGDVALAPSDSAIVWVGTGEGNPRNSVSPGDGVYKSTDGGKNFVHVGLADSKQIGRIAIHPTDPNTVFVAAVGHTWGPNDERGLYRTLDAGTSWQRVLFVDANTGCIDVAIDPTDPSFVYAATWERQRDEFDGGDPAKEFGPGSGLWSSSDGGTTFTRLASGLPTRPMGRIGIELWAKDPKVLFALIETDLTGKRAPGEEEQQAGPAWLGVRGEARDGGYGITEAIRNGPAEKAGIKPGDLLLRIGDQSVTSFEELRLVLDSHKSGDEAEVVVRRGDAELPLTVKFGSRPGGSTGFSAGMQGGQNANIQDRQGGLGFETGGLFRSDDRGATWQRLNSIDPRPFYYSQVRADPSDAERLYVVGIQLHASGDGGKTFDGQAGRGTHPDHHALWIDPDDSDHLLLGNDGGLHVTWDRCKTWEMLDRIPVGQFYNAALSLERPYKVYGGLQDNGSWGGPSATRRRSGVPGDAWLNINGGDGFHCAVDPEDPDVVYSESQNGVLARIDLRTGERAEVRPPGDHRFNWNTPFIISPHNARTLWIAGEEVFKSVNRGDRWVSVSPPISRTERGSATALAESPVVAGVVYVGTDDGALWLTRDGGRTWESLAERLPDLPGPRYVSDLECSRFDEATVYVTLDGHRSDDYAPYVFRSEDFGHTWKKLVDGLPQQPVRCLAASPRNRSLLFLGNEAGCFVSVDGGGRWDRLRGNLPTVPVFDLVLHPRERDLVAATHGRGIWILDSAPLEGMSPNVLAEEQKLLAPRELLLMGTTPDSTGYSAPRFHGQNPPSNVRLWYWLGAEAEEDVTVEVTDVAGRRVCRLIGPKEPGLHAVQWDLQIDFGAGVPMQPVRDRRVKVGDYLVTLLVGEKKSTATLHVEPDPWARPVAPIGENQRERSDEVVR